MYELNEEPNLTRTDVKMQSCGVFGAVLRGFIAKQPVSAPHMLRIVPHAVPRVGRSYEHFPDGFELHLLLSQGRQVPRREPNAFSRLGSALNPKPRTQTTET